MDDTGLGGFIESGADGAESLGGVLLLAGAEQFQITALECMQARFHAMVAGLFARAGAHAFFG